MLLVDPNLSTKQCMLYTERAFWDYHPSVAIVSTSQNESTKHNSNKYKKRVNIK